MFTRFAIVCETGREYLITSQLWDRSVREGEKLVIEIMEEASVEFDAMNNIIVPLYHMRCYLEEVRVVHEGQFVSRIF